MSLKKSLCVLRHDKLFMVGVKRGVGVILLAWLLTYVGGCVTYLLIQVVF